MNARVVLPTRNAGPEFGRLLAALRDQRPRECLAELVVVDSGSTDGTADRAREAGATVRGIDPGAFNHGATRAEAALGARTEALVFLVQDALPASERFLAELLAPLEERGVAGAYARVVPRPEATALVKRDVGRDLTAGRARLRKRIADRAAYGRWAPGERRVLCHFNNVASAIRTDVFRELPFRAMPFGEDLDWGKRALEAGHTIAFAPDAVVIHSHESGLVKDFERHRRDAAVEFELFGIEKPAGVAGAFARAARLTLEDLLGEPAAFAPALRLAQALGRLRGVREARAAAAAPPPDVKGMSNP